VNELRRPRQRLPRRRLLRWSLVGLAALVLLLGACVATAWVLFRLRGPELIRAELEGALVTALGRPARVGAVTFRPWPVALRVSEIAIASGASWEQGTLLRLDHGDVTVRLESLWHRRLVIGVTLTGIEMTATAAGGGDGNPLTYADLVPASDPAPRPCDQTSVRIRGDVRVDDRRIRARRPRCAVTRLASRSVPNHTPAGLRASTIPSVKRTS